MNTIVKNLIANNKIEQIENSAIKLFLDKNNIHCIKNNLISKKISDIDINIYNCIKENFDLNTINSLDKFFGDLFNEEEKTENGIVFTPEFIADYIVSNTIKDFERNTKIIDPSCGCGIFLISAIKYIKNNYNIKIKNIINNNIYGIDLKQENINRVKILITLFAILEKEDEKEFVFNLKCCDSLFNDWNNLFNIENFKYVIGNPPYVNNHDLKETYIKALKENFQTTQEGTFNTFYAFIEKSIKYLNNNGKIGYIIPNNFLHIKSAYKLRKFIKDNHLLNKIVDFKDNTVFSPILTYNCIVFLSFNNDIFKYSQIKKTKKILKILNDINFKEKKICSLDNNGWCLESNNVIDNIKKIESFNKLEKYIKTGIATLRDKMYILDGYDEIKKLYYKKIDNKTYYIEDGITKPFIKISKYKSNNKIGRIIYPYFLSNLRATVFSEEEIKSKYPLCYNYFLENKNAFIKTDKGKIIEPWYIYGRSQSLNLFDDKIIFSTFNNIPEFMDCPCDDALLSNGYCITNFDYDKKVLLKILNSSIMKYYVEKTSYSISGDFKCFQKKYIKNFSIPALSNEVIEFILNHDGDELDRYLFNLYKIDD